MRVLLVWAIVGTLVTLGMDLALIAANVGIGVVGGITIISVKRAAIRIWMRYKPPPANGFKYAKSYGGNEYEEPIFDE